MESSPKIKFVNLVTFLTLQPAVQQGCNIQICFSTSWAVKISLNFTWCQLLITVFKSKIWLHPNPLTVHFNDEETNILRRHKSFKKEHTMSFKDADDGFTHMLLYLGSTDWEATLKWSIKMSPKPNKRDSPKILMCGSQRYIAYSQYHKRITDLNKSGPFWTHSGKKKPRVLHYVLLEEESKVQGPRS